MKIIWVYVITILISAARCAIAVNQRNNINNNNGNKEDGKGCFSAIYSFGDSIADTGNALLSRPGISVGHLPYGETFFGKPTGRYSDGRIIIDFIAEACGLPLLDPNLNHSSRHVSGVNFAVGGATALSSQYFSSRHLPVVTDLTLEVQISSFLAYKSHFCAGKTEPNCSAHFAQALFVVGEIGGNDYNAQLLAKNPAPPEKVQRSVPAVVSAIQRALETLIEKGSARRIVVPNNFPVGCWPVYLAGYPQELRDSMGCMPRFNKFSSFGNDLLKQMITNLQEKYRSHGVRIVLVDYYAAAMQVLSSPQDFSIKEPLMACCGDEATVYKYNASNPCGSAQATACDDPRIYFHWDGIHLTEAAYAAMASLILDGSSVASPPLFLTLCHTDMQERGS